MSQDIELLEELQENFANQYGLTIMLTDEQGELITPAKGGNQLCNQLLNDEYGNFLGQIKDSLKKEWAISMPVIYDPLPGIHVITTPVESGGKSKVFLWAGVMVEEQTQHLVQKQLNHRYSKESLWGNLIENTPVLQPQHKGKWIQRAEYMSRLMSLCLKEGNNNTSFGTQAELFRESVQTGRDIQQQLSRLLVKSSEYDFLGLAERHEEDQYSITHVVGEGVEPFKGLSFSPGEGFLGRVLITGDHAYWENIENDPRSLFFHRHQFSPKSLFCYPINRHDGSISILFGGSLSSEGISKTGTELVGTLASILEVSLLTNTLRTENNHQLNRLSSLVEICKLMASTPDLKRILYILVDISINLVEGPFSCVVLRESGSEKVQLVSRGNIKAQDYVRNVVERHYDGAPGDVSVESSLPQVHETTWGGPVIECPLFYREELLGILCVGAGSLSRSQLKEHITFLHTLAIIGGVSLQLAKQEDDGFTLGRVEALSRAVGQFDSGAYAQSVESAKVAGEFVLKLGLPAPLVKDIINACQLSFYSPDFVHEVFPNSNFAAIVEEGKTLLEGDAFQEWNEASIGSQVFALAESYVEGRSLESFEKDEQGVFREFQDFIKETQIVEQEFTISGNLKVEQDLTSVADTIKEQVKLSPREQEVLDLVIRGMNNREIAEELYISGHTVKNHVTKIFQKLEVPDRAHAISKVYQLKYGS